MAASTLLRPKHRLDEDEAQPIIPADRTSAAPVIQTLDVTTHRELLRFALPFLPLLVLLAWASSSSLRRRVPLRAKGPLAGVPVVFLMVSAPGFAVVGLFGLREGGRLRCSRAHARSFNGAGSSLGPCVVGLSIVRGWCWTLDCFTARAP